jgi:thiol-disulfide isomerase/thioredoxin
MKRLDFATSIKKYDSLFAALNAIDDEYIKNNGGEFSWVALNERQSEYYGILCIENLGKQMPATLYQKVINHKAYLTSNDGMLFYQYLLYYVEGSVRKKGAQGVVANTSGRIRMLDSLFQQPKADFFKIKLSSKDISEKNEILKTVLPATKTEWCKTVLQEEYKEASEKLASINKTLAESKSIGSSNPFGQPIAELPFGAKLYKVDSLSAQTLLANLKNTFQNKALLIDFWATWCGPCLEQFPSSKKLHEDVKDLPLEFVYLCTSDGSNIEKWKAKIAEFKLSGTHIYVEKSIESELMRMFSGSGFPTYVLINPKGEFKPGIERPSHLDKEKLAEWIK